MHASHHFVFTARTADSDWPELQDRTLQELLRKWGLQPEEQTRGHAPDTTSDACGWLLRRFDYCAVSPATGRITGGDAAQPAAQAGNEDNNNKEEDEDDGDKTHCGFVSKPLPYHDGLAQDFLRAFFANKAVQAALQTRRTHATTSAAAAAADAATTRDEAMWDEYATTTTTSEADTVQQHQQPQHGALPAVSYTTLSCRWTSLAPFARLAEAKVIRGPAAALSHKAGHADTTSAAAATKDDGCAATEAAGQHAVPSNEETCHAVTGDGSAPWPVDALRMPIVKRMESVLPPDIVIADELRALLLAAHSRRGAYDAHDTADSDHTQDESNEDDEDDDDDCYGYGVGGSGAKLPLRTLRRVFSRAERDELLYHVLWRLVAGGGAMNQFEDDFAIYRHATRLVLRALLANGGVGARCEAVEQQQVHHVQHVVVADGTQAGQKGTQDGDEAAAASALRHAQPHYVPQVQAHVYSVTAVTGYDLFARQDALTPSNFNYCYVIVLPARQQVVLWYHSL